MLRLRTGHGWLDSLQSSKYTNGNNSEKHTKPNGHGRPCSYGMSEQCRLPACLFWPFVTPSGAVDEAGIHVICATGTWSRGIEASPKLQVLNFFFSRAIRPLSTLGSRGKKRSRPSPGARQRLDLR
ncbi:hypothetical protein CIRG_09108 [Coccidioides immitis RMSCC 2394]|uniref:Uncharacterized protein n=1 Tax=Coccidioides immitis RMSCC 2394 TaxID=404692 RepID=A0A0J6YRH3_COCIT|nr:hypothetical protein CIRG_09108 [Coccidioides immitis RMSCC 2394]